jgi:hypothetical protein
MGMFDTVYCNYPLPVSQAVVDTGFDYQGHDYQTKDLNNCLCEYTITEEGDLIEKVVEREWVDDDNAFFKGYMKETASRNEKVNYHGIIRMYTYHSMDKNINGEEKEITITLEYEVKFTNGKLETINLIQEEIEDTTERKEEQDEFFNKIAKQRNKWYNKYIFNTKGYNSFVKMFIIKPLYNLHILTGKLHMWSVRTF